MKRVPLAEARDHLSELVNDAAHGDQRILLESRGRPKAALIGLKDLDRLERSTAEAHGASSIMMRWLLETEKSLQGSRKIPVSTTDILRELREEGIAEGAGVYRRQRRTQAGRRRRR